MNNRAGNVAWVGSTRELPEVSFGFERDGEICGNCTDVGGSALADRRQPDIPRPRAAPDLTHDRGNDPLTDRRQHAARPASEVLRKFAR
jgi:hypothetical protein